MKPTIMLNLTTDRGNLLIVSLSHIVALEDVSDRERNLPLPGGWPSATEITFGPGQGGFIRVRETISQILGKIPGAFYELCADKYQREPFDHRPG
jgi:hypothetical protein